MNRLPLPCRFARTRPGPGGRPLALGRTLALAAALTLGLAAGPARAQRPPSIDSLAQTLAHSRSEKARIGAAVALGRSRDPHSVGPLTRALGDSSNVVRALACTALGYLADPAALPALERATRDRDRTVRRHAAEAVEQIRSHAGQRGGRASMAARRGGSAARSAQSWRSRPDRLTSYSIVPHESPRAVQQIYLVLKSAQDKSSGAATSRVRLMRANHVRSLMVAELRQNQQVTLMASEADKPEVEPYAIDVTMEKLDRRVNGPYVEIECEIRIAISNRQGKMLSFLTGGAKVQVPRRTFRTRYEPQLRAEAMENAVKSVHQDLVAYLSNRHS